MKRSADQSVSWKKERTPDLQRFMFKFRGGHMIFVPTRVCVCSDSVVIRFSGTLTALQQTQIVNLIAHGYPAFQDS